MTDLTRAGLCATCVHVRLVPGTRDAVYFLCEYSKRDASYRKYPVIPVRSCAAYRETQGTPDDAPDRSR